MMLNAISIILVNDVWRSSAEHAVPCTNESEIEATALYMNAARAGKSALCICTISDSLVHGTACSAEERQTSFTNMMEIAFNII